VQLGDRVGGRDDRGLGVEHLLDALGADRGARDHHAMNVAIITDIRICMR
jgi:hypothetical protein